MPSPQEREEALFQAAAQLSAAERVVFLNGACHDDPARRQRLDALLAARDQPGGLPVTAASAAKATIKLELTDAPGEAVGQTLGRYKLLERVGEGGCGVVYVAEQTEPVRRRVALKVIKLGMDTKQVVARFEAERQALAMMDHPNIAKVLDAGATETGRLFFVMELIRGLPITNYCNQNGLFFRQRLELFVQICHAVQHAHQKGIIHRDLKPSNILVVEHEGVVLPKVIDFGIAKATGQGQEAHGGLTSLHQFIGTPAYMSPEQVGLGERDVDTRSDIYSLGVILYELVTGQPPFHPPDLARAGFDELRRIIREVDPPLPSTTLTNNLNPNRLPSARGPSRERLAAVRGDMDWIVMKCLEKDRTRRYDTASDLAMDIRRHLQCEPVLARPPSRWYEFQKTVRRHKVGFAATAAIILVLAVGIALTIWQAVRATRAEALASNRLWEAEAISTFLTDVFQSPDPARDGRTITVAETLDTAVQRLKSDLAGQPAQRAKLQATLGKTYLALGLSGDAISLLKQAQVHSQSAVGRDHRNTLAATRLLALAYFEAGARTEAIPLQEDSLARYRRINGPESREAILVMMDLGSSYGGAGREKEALALRAEALRLSRKVNGPEHADTVRALHGLAMSYPHAQALSLREEAYALSRKVNGLEHPATIRAAMNLELSYAAQGREEDRLKLLQELVPVSFKVYGADHRFTRRSLENLERAYYAAGRWQDAVQLKADYARWDPKELNVELLVVQAWFGRNADYASSCRRLLKFVEGTQVPTTAERAAKGCLLLPTTDAAVLEPAHTLARRAVELGAEHQFLGWFQLALGMAEFRLGNYRAADKMLVASERMAPINSGFFRAMSLYRQGQPVEARRLFDMAVTRMRPLPDDNQNPLASGASGDDIIAWLACREAAAMLGIEASGSRPVLAWVDGLRQEVAENRADSIRSLQLALALLWLGRPDEHEAHCQQFLSAAASSNDVAVHDRAAKAYLLRPHPEAATMKLASASARRALELAQPGDSNLPWFRTVAGAAAYREGNLVEADALLSQALANPLHENQRRLALAFRAMARSRAGQLEAARADLAELTKLDLVLPDRTRMSPVVRDQDQLAVRLAYDEAFSLLKAAANVKP